MSSRVPPIPKSNLWARLQILLLFAAAFVAHQAAVFADPASPAAFELRQPDGTVISLHVRGDEWFHWYETADGRPVRRDPASGFWVYLLASEPGTEVLSAERVGLELPTNPGWQPRPTAAQMSLRPSWDLPVVTKTRLKIVAGTGTALVPVLLAEFSDLKHTITSAAISKMLFDTTAGAASMANYFYEVSYGKFTVAAGPSGVQEWIPLAKKTAAYAPDPGPSPPNTANTGQAAGQFVLDTVLAAIAAGYNFGPYQGADGKVAVVNLVHSGRGEEDGGGPNAIWSHRYSLTKQGLQPIRDALGRVMIDDYVIQPELLIDKKVVGASTIGVFCHEYGHALGLPDLYDTTNASEGIGRWSLMGSGNWNGLVRSGDCPAHLDAWCKFKLGWVDPINYTVDSPNVEFPSAATKPFAAKLWRNGLETPEYFLLENRFTNGFDAALPGPGLLIWHIDDTKGRADDNRDNTRTWFPNGAGGTTGFTNSGNFHVQLMQADNLWQLNLTSTNQQNTGDAGDPFPGTSNNRVFGPNTSPNSYSYNVSSTPGNNSFVTVSNISGAGLVMTAGLYTRSPNSGPEANWVNIAGVVPPSSGAHFIELNEGHPVVIRAFPGPTLSGLNQVQLYINRALDGRWWDFAAQQWQTNVSSRDYTVKPAEQNGLTLAYRENLPDGTNLLNGNYDFIVRVINNAKIPTEIRMMMTAAHAPEVRLSLVDNSVVNNLTNFTAFASETSGLGVRRLELALYYDGASFEGNPPTRWFWGGQGWVPSPFWLGADFPTQPAQASFPYRIGPDATYLLAEKQYFISARATDSLGDAATNTISVFYDSGPPATIYWRYPAGGNWFDAANWEPNRVPSATDDVVVNAPGDYTVSVNGAVNIASLRFGRVVGLDRQHLRIPLNASLTLTTTTDTNKFHAHATLDQVGDITGSLVQFSPGATWNWTGGTVIGAFLIAQGGTLNLSGDADKTLNGATRITSGGTATWSGTGLLRVANGGRLLNNGIFRILSDVQAFNFTGGRPVFVNNGTFIKSGGTSATLLTANGGLAFDNNGIVDVQGGLLSLGGGGTSSNGTFTAAAGARIELTGGEFVINGNSIFSGGGKTRLLNGLPYPPTLTFGGTSLLAAGATLELGGGTSQGTGLFTGSGTLNWTGGEMGAVLTLPATATFNLSGENERTLSGTGLLTSGGTGSWSGTGRLRAGNGGRLVNNGTFTILDDAQVFNYTGGRPVFVNNGTVLKAAGTNTAFLTPNGGMAFDNNGLLNVQSGVFSAGGGGSGSNGTFTASSGARIELAAGTFQFNGASTFGGAGRTRMLGETLTFGGPSVLAGGTLEVGGGSVLGTSSFTGTGTFNWTGGEIGAVLSLPATATFNLSGENERTLSGTGLLTSGGTGTWSGKGRLRAGNGGRLVNDGTFAIVDDAQVFNYTGGRANFVNNGTVLKSSGTNTTFLDSNGGMAFDNNGVLNVQSGVFSAGGGGTGSNGTYTASSGARIDLATGPFQFNGTTTFGGAGRTRMLGQTLTFGGPSVLAGGTLEVAGGTVSGTSVFTGAGTLHWTGGTIGATITLPATANFNLSSGSDKSLAGGGQITSAGAGSWSGAGQLRVADQSKLINSGTFTILSDAQVFNYTGGRSAFVNNGTVLKSAGTNTTFLPQNGSMAFNNNGILSVQSGVFSLSGGGAGSNGTFTATSGGRIELAAGEFAFNGSTTISGAGVTRMLGGTLALGGPSLLANGGTLEVGGGTVMGASVFAGSGALNWSGGTISAVLTLPPTASLNLIGEGDKSLGGGGQITSAGAGSWSGPGRLRVANGSQLVNNGTFTVLGDGQVFNYTGGRSVFVNNGTFLKAGGTNTTFLADNSGMAFNNNGTIDLVRGSLTLNAGYTPAATSRLKLSVGGPAAIPLSQLRLGGIGALDGTLAISLANGFSATNGASFTLVTYGSVTSHFNSEQLPAATVGQSWKLDYGATALTLGFAGPSSPQCVPPPSGLISWWPGEGDAQDIVGANHGTFQGGVTNGPGKIGEAFYFDGVDGQIQVPASSALQPAKISIEAWVNLDSLDSETAIIPGLQYIVFKKNSREFSFEGFALLKHRIEGVDLFSFAISSAEGVPVVLSSTSVVVPGKYYHLVGTFDNAVEKTARLFVNGIQEASQAATFPLDYGDRPLFIGSSGESAFDGRFAGAIDEVSIYDRALSAEEIATLFKSESIGKCPPTVPAGNAITGTVLDTNGKGVEGAEVAAFRNEQEFIAFGYSRAITSAKSDAQGNYTLNGLPLDSAVELIPRFDANVDRLDNDHRYFIKASQPFAANGTFFTLQPFVLQSTPDSAPPSLTMAVPGDGSKNSFTNLVSAKGTASDSGSGVLHVWGQLFRDDASGSAGFNWQTAGFDVAPDSPESYAPAVLAGSTWDLFMPPLREGAYRLRMTAMDNARNTAFTTTNFSIVPVIAVIDNPIIFPPIPGEVNTIIQATNGVTAQVPLPPDLTGLQLTASGTFNAFLTIIIGNGQIITFPLGVTLTLNGNLALSGTVKGLVRNLAGFLGKTAKTISGATQLPNLPGVQPATRGLAHSIGLQTIAPPAGDLTGLMRIEGDYSQGPDGHSVFAIASLANYDRLQLSGAANLAGTIVLFPIDSTGALSSLPLPLGSVFDLLEARSIQLNGVTLAGPVAGKLQVINLPNGRQALRATIQSAAQRLAIQQKGASVEISFPATDAILEGSPQISPPVWTTIPTVNGLLTLTPSAKLQFFRLKP